MRRLALTLCAIFIVLSYAGTLYISLSYIVDPKIYFEFFGDRDQAGIRFWQTMLHIMPATVALLIGPVQFLQSIRKHAPNIHVITGRIYLGCILASAFGALAIAPFTLGGNRNALGFALLALAWIGTTLAAIWHIRKGRANMHRALMAMSYALTLAGVTLRLQLGLFTGLMDMPFAQAYAIVAWSSWIPNMVAAGFWIRFRPMTPRSPLRIHLIHRP